MPSLKDLKNRIVSVKSTRKITSAMKMVAASKLRRAEDQAKAARPYAQSMARMMSTLAGRLEINETTPKLITGTGKEETVLLIVATSDRGLCGFFNGSVVREARHTIQKLEKEGKKVLLICVGRKGRDLLRREHGKKILHTYEDMPKKLADAGLANEVTARILSMYDAEEFDTAYIIFNRFKSAMSQIITVKKLVPIEIRKADEPEKQEAASEGLKALYELFEPERDVILAQLLPRNLAVQVFEAFLESSAGEQGARMTAMDNATRNAGEMIDKLTMNYNRSRQAYITKELIEIISGAEAV
ncbi:MAG: F0F1 ATP synthase subunit gamma [Alphaproteobacteria bacterium]|nr:F0F1 ATP synthase subunit gamma [Alphaproteobacteria bacterium]